MSNPPQSQASSFHLDAPVAEVLPLFTADGERGWAPGWNPEMLSGDTARGSTFRTVSDAGVETVWVVAAYRPEDGHASYARVAQGSNVGLVDVDCRAASGGGTDVTVRYTLTGLSERGREFVRDFLQEDHYRAMIGEWAEATARALSSRR